MILVVKRGYPKAMLAFAFLIISLFSFDLSAGIFSVSVDRLKSASIEQLHSIRAVNPKMWKKLYYSYFCELLHVFEYCSSVAEMHDSQSSK